MALEDYIEPEVAVAVAASALLFSPRARQVARRGAVLGVAGAMKVADTVGSAARGMADQAQSAVSSDGSPQGTSRPVTPRPTARTRA
jgi:hypothetical protein